MKKTVVWRMVAAVIVLTMILTACAPAATPTQAPAAPEPTATQPSAPAAPTAPPCAGARRARTTAARAEGVSWWRVRNSLPLRAVYSHPAKSDRSHVVL